MLRRLAALALCSAVALAGVSSGRAGAAGPSPTPNPDPTGVQSIHRAYNDLLGLFYKPLDPPTLLQSGWDE